MAAEIQFPVSNPLADESVRARWRPSIVCAEVLVWLFFLTALMVCGAAMYESSSLGWWNDTPSTQEILAALGLVAGFLLPLVMLRAFPGESTPRSKPWPVLAYLPLVIGALLALWIGVDDFHRRRLVWWVAFGACSIFTALLILGVRSLFSERRSQRRLFWTVALVVMITWCASAILYGASLGPQNALPWRQTVVDGVSIHHAPDQPLDPKLLRDFPKMLQGVEALWQHHFTRPEHLRIFLFPDDESLQSVSEALGTGEIAGLFDSGGTDAILVSAGPWAATGSTLAHEYCHALMNLHYNGLPSFLDEGMANYTELSLAKQLGQPPGDSEAIPEGNLADLFSESTFYEADPEYVFAGGFVASLVKRHGLDAFHRFCERVTAFSTQEREFPAIQDAFRKTYGGSLEVFVEQWRNGFPSKPEPTKIATSSEVASENWAGGFVKSKPQK